MKKLLVLFLLWSHAAIGQGSNPNIMYVSPKQFGAVFDGTADDIVALDSTVKYCMTLKGYQMVVIQMPPGICRITRPWVIGYRWVDESACFLKDPSVSPSYNVTEYTKCRQTPPISIEGSGATALFMDFDAANSSSLKAGIYYALQGGGTGLVYSGHITGLGIYAKGSFIKFSNGNWTIDPSITSFNSSNNQLGILGAFNVHLRVENCNFYGLREGIWLNNSYFMTLKNCDFKFCNRGYYSIRSHAGVIENVTVSSAAHTAFEIRSGQLVANNIYTTNCPTSLYIGTGSSVFNSCYLECNNATDSGAQVILGDNAWDSSYVPGVNGLTDGVVFNALTIVANKAGGGGVSLWMKQSARRASINGGSLQSSDKRFQDVANNELLINGVLGTFPLAATLNTYPTPPTPPTTYKRDGDATFRSVTIPAMRASNGETGLRPLFVDPNGKIVTQ